MNDCVKSDLNKWIIYHPHVIKYPIANNYIIIKLDDINEVKNTELHNKFILQVFINELQKEIF